MKLHTYRAYIRQPGVGFGAYQAIFTVASNQFEARQNFLSEYGDIFWPSIPELYD